MKKNTYSVTQVNQYIKNMFAQDFFLHEININGEVSNCKYHSSGHVYFTLKDEKGSINAILFSSYRKNLNFRMKDGDKIIVTGSIEVYERDGIYQIYAKKIQLDGEGNLYLKFEALKKELEEMGMFAEEYKQSIPRFVQRIGVVTAPTGAAIRDIQNVIFRRNPHVQIILYPALVQGDMAPASIIQGIHFLEQQSVDIMIVGRGGGSIEDLWAFNDEMVARAIFDCSVPIISAVGHETDWTIADFVADMRAPTPSAAAELAVFDYYAFKEVLIEKNMRMNRLMQHCLKYNREQLELKRATLKYLSPQNRLNEKRYQLVEQEQKLRQMIKDLYIERRHHLILLSEQLEGNSPLKKLSGGYAFIEDSNHKPLQSVKNIKKDDCILAYFKDGNAKAVIMEVNNHE